jgi:hypothetical protein
LESKRIRSIIKDEVEICKDCEYGYCCFDCRVLVKNTSANNNFVPSPLTVYLILIQENGVKKTAQSYKLEIKLI